MMAAVDWCVPLLTVLLISIPVSLAEPLHQPLLLMVGFDSFRWDFPDRGSTPNFDRIAQTGVRAQHLVNVFPTKSAPNWYSIMTGLYPESHGLVNNHVYEPLLNKTDALLCVDSVNPDPLLWDQTEPIWITNQRQGGASAVFNFFCGMNVNYSGIVAEYTTESSKDQLKPENIINEVVQLFKNGDINFAHIYFSDVDHACHAHGPESKEVIKAIEKLDNVTGYLWKHMKESEIHNQLNVMFVADHGHTPMKPSQVIFLNDYLDPSLYLGFQDNPIYSIFPHKDSDAQAIYDNLTEVEHITVWTKETIPEEYHYQNNKRIPPILIMTELGWNIVQNRSEKDKYWEKTIGEHGYANNISDMWPFFLAKGPAFRSGILSDPFSTLDIYTLACHILRIEPHPHNGSLENVKHLLVYDNHVRIPSSGISQVLLLVFTATIVLLIISLLMTCSKMIKYRDQTYSGRRVETEGLLSDEDL